MSEALEQILGNGNLAGLGETRTYTGLETYTTIDTYAAGTTALYSFDPPKPIGAFGTIQPDFGAPGGIRPIGGLGLQLEGPGNISTGYDLGEITSDSNLSGYELTERYDFGGHGQEVASHLNQDVTGSGWELNSGTSNKNPDGFKGLGQSHHLDLFKK